MQRKRTGCFSAPLVFGVVFIHVATPYVENVMYHPPHPMFLGPVDDVKQFAFSAQTEGQVSPNYGVFFYLFESSLHILYIIYSMFADSLYIYII